MDKKTYYPKPDQNLDFAALERDILKFWQENKIFEKSIEIRNHEGAEDDEISPVKEPCALKDHSSCRHDKAERDEFVFYDGPPFANGLPHYGHLLTGFIKDLVARYQTMKGKKVERKFGWDTHGLPVEMQTEKELGVSGQIAIQEYGIDKFNAACRTSVMKYADEWQEYITRQGRFVDFKNGYKTMDKNYMESVLWAFKSLYDKGLMYEDFRVVPYSWACQTPLSNFETKMDNSYREKASKAVTVKFELMDESAKKLGFDGKKVSLVAWTTTPWTLPSNLALGIGKNVGYVAMEKDSEIVIVSLVIAYKLAEKKFEHVTGCLTLEAFELYVETIQRELKSFTFTGFLEGFIMNRIFTGRILENLKYKPLFPYLANHEKIIGNDSAFSIIHGDFVTTDEGTGIVHMAPGFGEDDQILCKSHGIPTLCPVDEGGKFTAEMFDLSGDHPHLQIKGRQVFDTNDDIIKYLKATGAWIKTEQYLHNYPHCWRTDTPLIYKAVSSWYVEVTKFKDRMVELNQQINWIPDHIKDGQFGKWLEGARDWSISRNRFWGCPVPVWVSDNPLVKKIEVFGSLQEIEQYFGKLPVDEKGEANLHRPYIDELTKSFVDEKTGEKYTMKRVTDVLDCWFESGSMPYAQVHYPFENKEWFEQNFPADFITEYVAQTRGWFYTMTVLSTALFDRIPFKNVICHGTILDEKSQKLSKRLQNYPDPIKMFDEIGSDALRFYMISQPVMKGQELKIDKDGKAFRDALRLSLKPMINAYNFFCLYANSDQIKAKRIEYSRKFDNTLDNYILAKLKETVNKIDSAMTNYDTVTACAEFMKFFEVLNNWYIRRSRQRFWQSEKNQDKQDAYDALYTSLVCMCEAAAPLLPFTTEFVWKGLTEA